MNAFSTVAERAGKAASAYGPTSQDDFADAELEADDGYGYGNPDEPASPVGAYDFGQGISTGFVGPQTFGSVFGPEPGY